MPNARLPQEILEYIVDLIYDKPETLKRCCLVSKSWVPRTRKHLFASIRFRSAGDPESWKKTFPDVGNSPACHAHTLFVGCPRAIVAADAGEGGWMQPFSGITRLEVDDGNLYISSRVSLNQFHRFSSTLKSLRVCYILLPHPQFLDLICSFPLLEDLSLRGHDDSLDEDEDDEDDTHGPQTVAPSASPPSTGSLDLDVLGGLGIILRQLLHFPNGLHFRKITLSWDCEEDLQWVTELVARCSHTLESLDVTYGSCRTSIHICAHADNLILFLVELESAPFDLSKATKLRDTVFRPESENVEWITATLLTIAPEHRELRHISIHAPYCLTLDIEQSVGGAASRQLSDLDCLLVQFWESHSIRPRIGCVGLREEGQNAEYYVGCWFPEITKRGVVDLV